MKGIIEILEEIPEFIPESQQKFILAPLSNGLKGYKQIHKNKGGGAEEDSELFYLGVVSSYNLFKDCQIVQQ